MDLVMTICHESDGAILFPASFVSPVCCSTGSSTHVSDLTKTFASECLKAEEGRLAHSDAKQNSEWGSILCIFDSHLQETLR